MHVLRARHSDVCITSVLIRAAAVMTSAPNFTFAENLAIGSVIFTVKASDEDVLDTRTCVCACGCVLCVSHQ
jgi:hypothetical protein